MRVTQNKRLLQTVGYFAMFVALGATNASLGPTLPGLAAHTHTELNQISLLFTAHSLGYLFGSFSSGRLYDRMPGNPVLVVMLVTTVLMLAVAPLVSVLALLVVVWLVLGIAGGGLDVGGNALLVWVHGRKVGPYMNGLHFFFGVGSFLTPIIVAQALQLSGDINWAYWALALLVAPVALWLVFVPSPSASDPDVVSSQAGRDESRSGTRSATQERVLVLLIAMLLFLYVGAEASAGGWIFTFSLAQGLSTEATSAYLTSAFWGALTVGRLLAIPLAVRFRPSLILVGDLLGCLVSVAIILLWSTSAVALWLGVLGLGFSMASVFPTAISLAERRVKITGQVTGWFFVGASIGGMLWPWLIGQLFEPIGPQITMIVIAVDLVAALSVLAILILYSARTLSDRVE